MAMAIGCWTSGSAAATCTEKPGGTTMFLAASSAREAGVGIEGGRFGRGQLAGERLEARAGAVEAKIVEVDVPPAAGVPGRRCG